MPVMNIGPVPQSHDGFYATNNPYQVNGPKGFTEFKLMEENEDLFARLDFPGVTKESVRILVEPLKKAVFVFGDAPKEFRHDSSHRKYGTVTGLVCDCCEISNIQCYVGDGVVRLVLSKKKINRHVPSSCSFGGATMPNVPFLAHIIHGYNPEVAGGHPLDPAFTGPGPVTLPHPSVLEGSTSAYESKHLPNGGLFLRIDMPGVPNDRFTVTVESDGGVNVIGRAPPAIHDSSGREYRAKVAVVPLDYDNRRIKIFFCLFVLFCVCLLWCGADGFYAINNPFLVSGPKGFTEFKMLENEDMFIRIDFPGVPQEGVKVRIDPTKKAVSITADAPKEHKHDSSPRNYGSATGLVCKCCEISGMTSHMLDGVLRLHLSKTHASSQSPSCIFFFSQTFELIFLSLFVVKDRCSAGPHKFPHGTDPHDPALTGPLLEPHPCVNLGSDMAYEWKMLPNGGLYVRVDMPGVPKDRFTVSVVNGRVSVTGDAPGVSHDSGGRRYSGEVAMLESHVSIPGRKIKTIAKNGVIRLIIPPI
ncbi:unnamed protein product [Eruca vesicaria subsp. sativa]|uniref:SHSP domain-containing protein n=1 Tax=Eruca vesicaria subsp. sativa TaxID=29727 RepID=A0ABC8MBN1_ERUVS|nr:unnamed protein product [Eruca vesicaria subsp. sativa]